MHEDEENSQQDDAQNDSGVNEPEFEDIPPTNPVVVASSAALPSATAATARYQQSSSMREIAPLPSNFATVNETMATADVWADTTQEEADARLAEALYQQELVRMKGESYPYCEDAVAFVEEEDENLLLPRISADVPPCAAPDTNNHHEHVTTLSSVDETQEAFVIESAPIRNQPLPASVMQTDHTSQPIRRRRNRTVRPDAIVEVEDDRDQRYASLPRAPVWHDRKPPARPRGANGRMGSISEYHAHEYAETETQPALVLGIQEDVHPAEGHASAAEWIGSSTMVDSQMHIGPAASHASCEIRPSDHAPVGTADAVPFMGLEYPTAIPTATTAVIPDVLLPAESSEPESLVCVANGSGDEALNATMPTAMTLGEPMIVAEEGNDIMDSDELVPEEYNDEYMLKQRVENIPGVVPQESSFADQCRESSLEWLHSSDREYQQNIACTVAESSEQYPLNNAPMVARSPEQSSIRSQLNSLACDGLQSVSNSLVRSTSNAIEHLFGEKSSSNYHHRRSNSAGDLAITSVLSRTLLPWSVILNPTTNLWIATLQTNQRALDRNDIEEASRSLRVFSMQTETQAKCLARAWTPPRMLSFTEHKNCHICETKFAVLRRACHCRNCGVCICRDCASQWPAKMVPETYNTKKEFFVNVCKSCNWLCNSFRQALQEGKRDQAVALFSTGNVNLYTPFANVKGELFYPVHCAVLGNSLDLLRFLVDEHCCPIKSVRVNQSRGGRQTHTPIVTSRGRTLLGMAMEQENMGIIRYLIVEKGVDAANEPDITREIIGRVLFKALEGMTFARQEVFQQPVGTDVSEPENHTVLDEPLPPSDTEHQRTISEEAQDFGAVAVNVKHERTFEGTEEECILCCDNPMDCVASPCGHQMCCLACSEHLDERCPVCSAACTFMRIYKS